MRGHIGQRGNSWVISVDTGRDAQGKRRRHYERIKGSKRDAQRRLREILQSVDAGVYIKPTKLAVAQWLKEWLETHVETKCSARTKASYEQIIRIHIVPELGNIQLVQLTPQHLKSFYAKKKAEGKVSIRTIRYCHSLLRESLGDAVKMEILGRNVALAADPPKRDHKTVNTLALEHVARFLQAASETPYHVLFATIFCTGCRRGEALALRWKNVDLDTGRIYITESVYRLDGEWVITQPKTLSSKRYVPLPNPMPALLREHKAQQAEVFKDLKRPQTRDDFVFAHADGSMIDPSTVSHAFSDTLHRAGLPHLRLHDLRHTHASLLLMAGEHPKVVGERLGHSSVRTTLDTYSHVLPGLQEAAAQRFEKFLPPGIENGKW